MGKAFRSEQFLNANVWTLGYRLSCRTNLAIARPACLGIPKVIKTTIKKSASHVNGASQLLNVVSVRSGLGTEGWALDDVCVNHKHVMCCEIDPVLQGHLKHHFEPQYMVTDALTTKFINTPPPEFKGKIHLLVGGFPCQPFAGLGLHQGFNDEAGRGHVIHHIIKWIKKHEPRSFVLENVSGLLYRHKEEICIILKALKNLGKWRVSWKLINSSDHGVAQEQRVRKIMPGS